MKRMILYVSVTNDIVNDQRVIRIGKTLLKSNVSATVIGRCLKNPSVPSDLPFKIFRFRMLFHSGFFFYAFYNLRLFFYLLCKKVDILVANDLDTLLPNYLISRLKKIPLVYDSHEYFTGVPEIQERKFVLWVWRMIEKKIFPKLKYVYTVSHPIARQYHTEYGVEVGVVRNLPVRWESNSHVAHSPHDQQPGKHVIILQGTGINIDRGAEEAVEAMKSVENAVLWIIGSGDVMNDLKQKVTLHKLSEKVLFYDRMPYEELKEYTKRGSIGLSLDKDTNPNYRMSLPNKLFDYIQAGIPILASDLPEVGKVIREYRLGELIESHDPLHIAEKINDMLSSEEKIKEWQTNLKHAASELCWEKEEKTVMEMYERVGLEF